MIDILPVIEDLNIRYKESHGHYTNRFYASDSLLTSTNLIEVTKKNKLVIFTFENMSNIIGAFNIDIIP